MLLRWRGLTARIAPRHGGLELRPRPRTYRYAGLAIEQNERTAEEKSEDELEELASSIQLSPIATVVTDPRQPDNPIVAANDAFTRLTGYTVAEIVGRNCRFLGGPETESDKKELLRTAIEENGQVATELTNYRKDGSKFCNAIMIAPLLDAENQTAFFMGSQMAVSFSNAVAATRYREAKKLTSRLTRRQRQVLTLMADGFRNKEIAARLGLAEKTIKLHRSLALRSLGAQTSGDAIRIAVEAGLTSREKVGST